MKHGLPAAFPERVAADEQPDLAAIALTIHPDTQQLAATHIHVNTKFLLKGCGDY